VFVGTKCFIIVLSDYSSVSVQASHHIYLLVVVLVLEEKKAVFECSGNAIIALIINYLYTTFVCILYSICF
jgi:hypothetical protein